MTNRPRGVAWAFWKRVKDAQADLPMTDTDLHRLSGIARTTVANLEVGKRPPQARVVHALADALHIDREEALRLAGVKPADEPSASTGAAAVREAVKSAAIYTEEQRQMLLSMMDTFEQVNASRNRP